MELEIVIRSETEADIGAIRDVTAAAFKTLEVTFHEAFKAEGPAREEKP
jgi:predicted N-acetyltransferase YhbS